MFPTRLRIAALVALFIAVSGFGASGALTRQPFAAASTPAGRTRFTKLSPADTGLEVQNPYDDPQMWGARYRAFMGGAMGSGVAAGDFDGDGKVDVFVSTKTKPGRLYRNLGGWKFVDVTKDAGLLTDDSVLGWLKSTVGDNAVAWGQGAVFADVNNDGRLDLFVCRNRAPNLLYINQGDGTFKEEAAARGLALVDGSVVGAFADYDRDGALDVLILTNQMEGVEPSGRPDRLFHNDGKGFFTEVTARAGIRGETFGHAAVWCDYDADGWPDVYITNDFSGSDRLYHNNRDGTFTNVLDAVVPHTPFSSMGADICDVNNDGWFDLFVADMATTTREKDRRGLAASRDDVLSVGTKQGLAPQYTRNALLLNTGRGVFGEAACWAGLAATDWTWSPRFEDFDNDGWEDLHITNGMVREANNSDVLARMMRALSDQERISAMKRSPTLEESNLAYRNLHGTGFEPTTDAWGLGEVGVSFGSATADFDNDGDLDLVYLNYNGGLSVYRNDSTGAHRIQIRLRGTRSNRFGVGAVVRIQSETIGAQARQLTVARGYASGSELVAHFGLGADVKVSRLVVDWPSGIEQEFTDLDANYAYTVTEDGQGGSTVGGVPSPRIAGGGDTQRGGRPSGSEQAGTPPAAPSPASGLFREDTQNVGLAFEDNTPLAIPDREQAFLPFRTDRRGPAVAVGDIDEDGHDDLYIGATPASAARVLRWRSGTYTSEALGDGTVGPVEDGPALLFDAEGKGARDLLVTKASANAAAWPGGFQPILYANDGRGHFKPTDALPSLALNVGAACAADVDGDGRLDVFLGGRSIPGRYPETPQSALLRNVGGRFVDIADGSPALQRVGLVKSAVFSDVDGDGRPDLIVALEWDYVRCFHNDGAGRFSDWTEKLGFAAGGRGWWNGVVAADFNGDGRPDFAVGNLGLNTTYRATPEKPATLFYGDFAQNETKLVMEGVYDGERLFPVRARTDLGARLPFVLRKYPRNDDFARADLAQIFGEETLRGADRRLADNFVSGVFLSQSDGTYRFQPFPRVAQIGPIQGIVAVDVDGDGKLDLCAVQNTDIAIPRFDGGTGLVLIGKGDGQFVPDSPGQSGFLVPGNARALVLLDPAAETRPGLFATRLSGAAVFHRNVAQRAQWREVVLHGLVGNADAIGAKLTIKYSRGRSACYEVGLGGGWLSQTSPHVFVSIPPGENIVEAEIVWPGGRVTRHTPPPSATRWDIRLDGGSPASP